MSGQGSSSGPSWDSAEAETAAADPGTPPMSPTAATPTASFDGTRGAPATAAEEEQHVKEPIKAAASISLRPQGQGQWDAGTLPPTNPQQAPLPAQQQQQPAGLPQQWQQQQALAQPFQQQQQALAQSHHHQQQQQQQGGAHAASVPGVQPPQQDASMADLLAGLRSLSPQQLGTLLGALGLGDTAAAAAVAAPHAPVVHPQQQTAHPPAPQMFAMSAPARLVPAPPSPPAAAGATAEAASQQQQQASVEEEIFYQPPHQQQQQTSRGAPEAGAVPLPARTGSQAAAALPLQEAAAAGVAGRPPVAHVYRTGTGVVPGDQPSAAAAAGVRAAAPAATPPPPAAAAPAAGAAPGVPGAGGGGGMNLVLSVPQPVGNWQRNPCGAVFLLLDCKDQHSFTPGGHRVLGVYRCGNEAGSRDYCVQHRLHPLYLVLRDQSLSPIDTRHRLAPLLGVAQVTFVEEGEPRDLERKLAAAEATRVPVGLRLPLAPIPATLAPQQPGAAATPGDTAAAAAAAATAAAEPPRSESNVASVDPPTPSAAGSGVRRGLPSDITSSSSGTGGSSSAAARGKPPSLLLLRLHKEGEGGGVTREDVYLTRPVLSSYTGTPCSGVTLFTGEPRLKGSLCGNEASSRGRCRRHKLPITLIDAALNSTSVSSLSELAPKLGLVRVELLTAQGEPVEGFEDGQLGSWEFVAAAGGGQALHLMLPPPVGNYQTKACSAVEFTVKTAPGWAAGGWQGPGPPPLVAVTTCGNEAGNRRSCRSHTSLWQVSMLPAATPTAQLMEVKAVAVFKSDALSELATYLGVQEVVIVDSAVPPTSSSPAVPAAAGAAAAAAAAPSAADKSSRPAAAQLHLQQPPDSSRATSPYTTPLQGHAPGAGDAGTRLSPRVGPPAGGGAAAGGSHSRSRSSSAGRSRPGSNSGRVEHPASGVCLQGGELWLPVDPRPLGPWQNNACRALYILLDVPEGDTYTLGRHYPILAVERCGNEAGMRSRCRPHNEGAFALVNTQQQPLTRAATTLQELAVFMGVDKVHLYNTPGPLVELKSEHPACVDWSPSNANGTAAKVPWGYSGAPSIPAGTATAAAAVAAAGGVGVDAAAAPAAAAGGQAMATPAAAMGMASARPWAAAAATSVGLPGGGGLGYPHPVQQQDLLLQQQVAGGGMHGGYVSEDLLGVPSGSSQPLGPPSHPIFTHTGAAPFAAMFEQQQQQAVLDAALAASYNTMLPAALQAVTQPALSHLQPGSSTMGVAAGMYGSSGQVSPAAPFLQQQQLQQPGSDVALCSYNTMLPAALQAVTQPAPSHLPPMSSTNVDSPPGLYGSSGQVSPAAFLQQQQQAAAQGAFLPAWALQAAAAAAAAASEDMDTPMSTGPTMQGGWHY